MTRWLLLPLLGSLAMACSSGGDGASPGPDVPGVDIVVTDTAAPADVVAADAPPPPDAGGDALCSEGAWSCSDDALVLRTCTGGAWVERACMHDEGRLCEAGDCVYPWHYGNPAWPTCADETRGTTETLAEKAAYYDALASRLHIHPQLKWCTSVTLPRVEVPCADGGAGPCYEAAVDEAEATWEDVERFGTGENDGLWSGLYLASQAFRYGATHSEEALATIRLLLEGEVDRMRITGVPGVFTRQLIPPGTTGGVACPSEDALYTTDEEKDDNRWVQIRDDGCVWVVERTTGAWTKSDHCGLAAYAGWCWLDNVSQDEYAGHMFALGALWKLVDDPDVQATVRSLLEDVGVHLMENDLTFVDWDGRLTEHGYLYPTSLRDAPAFAAMLSLDYVLLAAEASGRDDLRAYYDDCLLQKSGKSLCLPWPLEQGLPFTDYLDKQLLYVGPEGCLSNFNNFSMLISTFHTYLWFEHDPAVASLVEKAFDEYVMRPEGQRIAAITQKNAWFNFIWASSKAVGPGSDGPALDAVEEAICSLKQFPASKRVPTLDAAALYPHFCDGRLGGSQAELPVPVADRCPRTFLWWASPYDRDTCTARPYDLEPPGDYLLAYWMGRYYGFIPPEL